MTYLRSRPQIRNRNSVQNANHQARLSLVAEVPSPQSEVPRRESILEEDNNPIGQALTTRSNSDTAMYAPIRRKSLLAHGVATRASYVEPDPPQSHPVRSDSVNDMQNYHYNPSKPTSSPLSDLAMLGPKPSFMNDGPRAETPTDEHYGHLGGFNGTLRITNGAASPAPSSHKRANSLNAEEDYSEAKKGPAMGHRHGLSQRSNTISVPAEATKPPWMVRSESPLRTSQSQFEPFAIARQVPNDPSFSMFDFEEEKKHFKRKEVPTKAQELADDDRHGITLSPFSFDSSPSISPQFQVTSKHTALEDELFESEPSSPDPSAPPAPSADHGSHLPRSFDSGYVGGEPSPTLEAGKEPEDSASKGLAKADSGYSSNVSLRSFKKDSPPTKEPNRRVHQEPASRVASSPDPVGSEATLRATEPQPALPVEEIPRQPSRQPPPPFRQAPPVPVEKQKSFESTPRKVQPPSVPQAGADQAYSAQPHANPAATPSENRPQENTPPAPGTYVRDESPATSDTSASPASSSRWRQKLTKRESQHRVETGQVFTVQAIRFPSEAYKIPPPTVEARRRLEEREEAFPVQSFPNTIEGNFVSRRMSMGTIFSVGSVEASDETNFSRPPVPPMPTILQEPAQQSRPEKNRRNTYQGPARSSHKTEQQEAESTQPVSRGRTPFPSQMANWARKSLQNIPPGRVPRQVEDFESHVTSLETVASPDDGARPSIVDQRAKSVTAQFEADAATRFAVSKQRNSSSEASTVLRPRKSYDSIANSGSGTSTSNSSRTNLRDASSLVQSSATRRSYTNLPAQPSLLNPDGVERRKSSKSPPPISMPNRVQSVTRKPVPPPQSQPARFPPPPPAPTPSLMSSPLSHKQDALAWNNRRRSTASLMSTTTVSFETARRPDTYEIVDIDDFKKRHEKKRASTMGLPLVTESAPNSRPTSSKGWGKSRDSMMISVRDRDEIPRTTYNDLGMKKKLRKSKESLHLPIRPRSSGPGLDAVSERDEMPRLPLQSPTLPLQSRRSTSKENIGAGNNADGHIPEVPKVVFDAYLSGAGDMGGQREIIRRKVKGRKSEETLTLRDLQIEQLAKRRPRSVQPSKSEQRAMKERERERQEELKRLEQERGKEHRKSRWGIFGGDKEKELKGKISKPMPLSPQEYTHTYGTAHTYSASPISQQQQEDEYYAQAHQQQDQLVLDRYAMRNNIMGNVRV